jgi:starch phosphorylase
MWEEMGVTRDGLLAVGRHPAQQDGRFHMTALAIRLSGRINGVAQRHGEVSREIWHPFWPDKPVEQVPIGAVTNGVHLATWMSDDVKRLLDGPLGADWERRRDDVGVWDSVHALDDAALWATHRALKGRLSAMLREQARRRWAAAKGSGTSAVARGVAGAGTLFDPEVLTIGFARRFATYKRADLIFHDLERLRRIITDVRRPVQIVFAGKAHPADDGGKRILQTIYAYAQEPAFSGRVAFVEDYDTRIAARLVQGVDLWLNVPRVPMEASGTSGMKAALNGVPQLSTLDGWWPEAYDGRNGWAIPASVSSFSDATAMEHAADEADAVHLYRLLESEVVPRFYDRDETGRPAAWIAMMKHAICVAGRQFTTRRMLQDYATGYYEPAMRAERSHDDPPTA